MIYVAVKALSESSVQAFFSRFLEWKPERYSSIFIPLMIIHSRFLNLVKSWPSKSYPYTNNPRKDLLGDAAKQIFYYSSLFQPKAAKVG